MYLTIPHAFMQAFLHNLWPISLVWQESADRRMAFAPRASIARPSPRGYPAPQSRRERHRVAVHRLEQPRVAHPWFFFWRRVRVCLGRRCFTISTRILILSTSPQLSCSGIRHRGRWKTARKAKVAMKPMRGQTIVMNFLIISTRTIPPRPLAQPTL